MFKIWIHGGEHFLMWLMSVCVICALNLALNDLIRRDVRIFPEDWDVVRQNSGEPTRKRDSKFVIVFIEGLDYNYFVENVHKSQALSRAMASDGVWGHLQGANTSSVSGFVGIEPFFTGNPEGHGPSFLVNFDKITFAGMPNFANGFKLPKNYSGSFQFINLEEKSGNSTLKNADFQGLIPVLLKANNGTLWNSDSSKDMLIVHLTAFNSAVKLEGRSSLKANFLLESTFQQLDSLISTLESKSPAILTYFVTSVGLDVPLVAWGPGIDRASSADRQMLQYEYSPNRIPITPRDLNVLSIAPLISCLLDVPPPDNSMGILPDYYLSMESYEISNCHLRIVRQVTNLYVKQAKEIINGGLFGIASFPDDLISVEDVTVGYEQMKRTPNTDYSTMTTLSSTLVMQCLNGIKHYRNFRSHILSHLIFFSLVGCIWCGIILVAPALTGVSSQSAQQQWEGFKVGSVRIYPAIDFMFGAILIILLIIFGVDHFPLRYLFYVSTAIVPWWVAFRNIKNLSNLARGNQSPAVNIGKKMTGGMYIVLSIITGIVTAYDGSLIAIFLVSTIYIALLSLATPSDVKVSLWLFTTIPLVTVLGKSFSFDYHDTVNTLGGLLWLTLPWIIAFFSRTNFSSYAIIAVSTGIGVIVMSGCCSGFSCHAAWLMLLFIPVLGSQDLLIRFTQAFMSIGVGFLVISKGWEPLTLIIFVLHLATWMLSESHADYEDLVTQKVVYSTTERETEKKFDSGDLRMNYYYNLYCMLATVLIQTTEASEDCNPFSQSTSLLGRFFQCRMKMATPILFASMLYSHMMTKNGTSRFYSLLLSFLYFTFSIFLAFLPVYRFGWYDPLPNYHQLTQTYASMNVWISILFCSLIADCLLFPSFLVRNPPQQVQ